MVDVDGTRILDGFRSKYSTTFQENFFLSTEYKRVILSVKRWRQHECECAIAAASSIAHFYDPSISYKQVRKLVAPSKRSQGLYSSQQGRLLNKIGFNSVWIVTADLSMIDFSWRNMTKSKLIEKLKRKRAWYGQSRDKGGKRYVDDMIKWLEDNQYDNQLVIDDNFAKFIRKELNKGRPVGAAFNWTSLFKFKKGCDDESKDGDIRGSENHHAVVIRGYDTHGVFVVDSHTGYSNRLRKYKRGFYKLSWDRFLVNIPGGDLILV
jgi:hypothetical protein